MEERAVCASARSLTGYIFRRVRLSFKIHEEATMRGDDFRYVRVVELMFTCYEQQPQDRR